MTVRQILSTDWIELARRMSHGLILLLVFALPALALNPEDNLSQYGHTSWGADAGIQAVRRIKQTPDGYLWLATRVGLVRFDGVRFATFKAGSGNAIESSAMQDIVIDPDGSMWIATLGGGIVHYQAGKFSTYTVKDGLPSDEIGCLYRDSGGTLWVGTRGAGIARMVGGHFENVALAIPPGDQQRVLNNEDITALLEGPDHSLWVADWGYGVFRLQNGAVTSFTVKEGLPDDRVSALYSDHSGTIWTAGWKGISSWNGNRFIAHSGVDAVVSFAISLTEDRDGNFWIASSSGLFRVRGEQVNRIAHNTGLSGDFVSDVFEDKEGNLWVGTRAGLDQFRNQELRLFSQLKGPVLADNQGVWTVSNQKITHIAADTIRSWPASFPPDSIHSILLSAGDAGLSIGFNNGIKSWTGDHTDLASEWSGLDVLSLLRAHDGSIWMGTANRGLLHWVPSARSRHLIETGVSDRSITTLAEDRTGAIWAGSNLGGGLYCLSGKGVQHFGPNEGLPAPEVYAVFVDEKNELWIGSTGGLSWFQDGRIRTVNSREGLPSDQVFAILDDSYDRLWFTGFAGIATIDKKSLTEWAVGRSLNVNPLLYRSEGLQVRTVGNVFPNSARTPDGHLWFSIADGLAEVTPPNPATSAFPQFPVLVEDVTVDGVPHTEFAPIRMRAGTRSIELSYTALTLSNAQAVRFRYQLEGIDNDWVDAGTRRLAFYNNLKPGAYKFRVAARVGEEQWQESSVLVLEQLPFFYQTWWFMLVASIAVLSLAFLAYRFRVHQITRDFDIRLGERIDERTRIARELHDTLLQSFQGLMFEFQAARNILPKFPENEKATRALDEAIVGTEQAIAEGRDAIHELRPQKSRESDLGQLLTTAGRELAALRNQNHDLVAFRVTVEGKPQTLLPTPQDEVYRIGREIIRNAFNHADAHSIEVEIRYDDQRLRLRIRDDGRGIDPKVMESSGRVGHWGLPGMRERAQRIGARLDFWSKIGAGTEVELTIPSAIAYRVAADNARFRLFRKAGSRGQRS